MLTCNKSCEVDTIQCDGCDVWLENKLVKHYFIRQHLHPFWVARNHHALIDCRLSTAICADSVPGLYQRPYAVKRDGRFSN